MTINSRSIWFSGEEVLVEDMTHEQNARTAQEQVRVSDFWQDGILKDANGLSNMLVTVDALTATLINVGHGTAYSGGFRIDIHENSTFNASAANYTTDGTCTPQPGGNQGIPLANYTLNQPNYIWAKYLAEIGAGRRAVSLVDGVVHYPNEYDSYQVIVTTTNPPGNPVGITNSVYLATVYGQGVSQPLLSAPTGITDLARTYTSIKPQQNPTSNIANGAVRGSSANSGGSQREILQGSVSAPDFRDAAVIPRTIDQSQTYYFGVGSSSRVGIGVSSPTSKLHVRVDDATVYSAGNPATFNTMVTVANTTSGVGTTASIVLSTESNGEIDLTAVTEAGNDGAGLAITTRNTGGSRGERVRITKAGSVGIGTSSPAHPLDVVGNLNASGKLYEASNPLIPSGARMPFYNSTPPAGWVYVSAPSAFIHIAGNGTGGGYTTATDPTVGFNLEHTHPESGTGHRHVITPDGAHVHDTPIATDSFNSMLISFPYGGPGLTPFFAGSTVSSASQRYGTMAGENSYTLGGYTWATTAIGDPNEHSHGGYTGYNTVSLDNRLSASARFSYIDCVIGEK